VPGSIIRLVTKEIGTHVRLAPGSEATLDAVVSKVVGMIVNQARRMQQQLIRHAHRFRPLAHSSAASSGGQGRGSSGGSGGAGASVGGGSGDGSLKCGDDSPKCGALTEQMVLDAMEVLGLPVPE
jgi:uncharacterized membrane protein YgcG